ncbi:MAG: hypothetical protein NC034_07245, partial [Ruminococcus sp.]|nr:hypothetical protein [Ruminococcus sp.]
SGSLIFFGSFLASSQEMNRLRKSVFEKFMGDAVPNPPAKGNDFLWNPHDFCKYCPLGSIYKNVGNHTKRSWQRLGDKAPKNFKTVNHIC